MWQELDPFNLCPLKAQKQAGWQCQEIGGLTGNLMLISMASLCPLKSQILMDRPDSSRTLLQQIGDLARLSLVQYSSKLIISSLRVQGLNWPRRAYNFTRAARHNYFSDDGWDNKVLALDYDLKREGEEKEPMDSRLAATELLCFSDHGFADDLYFCI
jgi:hypothetical protein